MKSPGICSQSLHARSQPLRRCLFIKLHPKNKSASAGLLDALHAIHKTYRAGSSKFLPPSPYFLRAYMKKTPGSLLIGRRAFCCHCNYSTVFSVCLLPVCPFLSPLLPFCPPPSIFWRESAKKNARWECRARVQFVTLYILVSDCSAEPWTLKTFFRYFSPFW